MPGRPARVRRSWSTGTSASAESAARSELVYATPLDDAFTKPVASEQLGSLLAAKEIELVTEFNAGEVDGAGGKLTSYDGREFDFDLLVTVPLHGGAAFLERSPGLGDALGFVPTDRQTLQSQAAPNVFALGDATDLPTSKAGSVDALRGRGAERERRSATSAGEDLDEGYDGHANCFIETGFHKALLIDFNYDTEPLPGHFPTAFGLPLLRESRLNHLGKLAFQWVYWHALLPGREIPGIGPTMPTARQDPDPNDELRGVVMPTTLIAQKPVDLDAEGFLTRPEQWNEEIAEAIASDNGIPELTDRHWLVVRFMRERYLATGSAPSIRSLGKESGVPVKELYQLFPKGPAKLAARIGGIPKPTGCI